MYAISNRDIGLVNNNHFEIYFNVKCTLKYNTML